MGCLFSKWNACKVLLNSSDWLLAVISLIFILKNICFGCRFRLVVQLNYKISDFKGINLCSTQNAFLNSSFLPLKRLHPDKQNQFWGIYSSAFGHIMYFTHIYCIYSLLGMFYLIYSLKWLHLLVIDCVRTVGATAPLSVRGKALLSTDFCYWFLLWKKHIIGIKRSKIGNNYVNWSISSVRVFPN